MAFLENGQFLNVGTPPSSEFVTFRLSIFSKEDQIVPTFKSKGDSLDRQVQPRDIKLHSLLGHKALLCFPHTY